MFHRPHNSLKQPRQLPLRGKDFWTRSVTLAMAQQSCTFCHGLGLRPGRGDQYAPCNCVFRAVFRQVYARFRSCVGKEKHVSRVSLEANPGRIRRATWGLKNEEFCADFCLLSRHVLDEVEYCLFKFHFLLGADWKLCCRRLNLNRGEFFHEVYRIQQRLGRVFAELLPFALWPLEDYFSSNSRRRRLSAREEAELALARATEQPKPTLLFPVRRSMAMGA